MIEREIKLLIEETEYKQCKQQLDLITTPKEKLQINYYFESEDFALNKSGKTLRIRQIGTELMLQYKYNKYREGVVNICEEYEKQLSKFQVAVFSTELPDSTRENCDIYKYIGCLVTQRLDYSIGQTVISLDKNLYLGEQDFEIECEFPDFNAVKEAFRFLPLANANNKTCSKYKRFFQKYVGER